MIREPEFRNREGQGREVVRILLLEDDQLFAELIKAQLHRMPWVESRLELAGTLGEALAKLAAGGGFSLVVTDLSLPDSSGIETVRALARAVEQPIVVLTGDDDPALRAAALECGAYDFLTKGKLSAAALERLVRLAALQATAHRALRESEARFRSLNALSSDWYWETDAEHRFVNTPPRVTQITGLRAPSYLGKRRWEVPGLMPVSGDWQAHRVVLERRESYRDLELVQLREDGSRVYLQVSGEPVRDAAGNFKGYRGTAKDISERKRSEQAVLQLGRMYAALGAANEAILRAKSPEEMFERACEIAVAAGGFVLGTVYLLDPLNKNLSRAAASGTAAALAEVVTPSIDESQPGGKGLIAHACRSGQSMISNDYWADAKAQGRRPSPRSYEIGSAAVFLLRVEAELAGVFGLQHAERDAFSAELTALLQRLADNISFALENFRAEARRHEAKRKLGESEQRFRSLAALSSDTYWEQDAEYRFTTFSGAGSDKVRPGRGSMIGKRRWEQRYFNMSEADWAAHKALLDARQPFSDLELGRVSEAGEKVWLNVSGEPFFDDDGRFKGYRGVGRDITARKRVAQLRELEHTVTRSLAQADSLQGALRGAIRAVCETEGWEVGRYFSPDPKAGVLRLSAAWGVENEAVQGFIAGSRDITFAPGQGLTGRVWQSGQPLWIPDVSADGRSAQPVLHRASGMRGAFVFPAIAEGRTIGVLGFNSRDLRQPEEDLLQAIGVIGNQIGQFVQRKQAEDVLRESESRFRSLTSLSSDWYWEQDAELRFTKFEGRGSGGRYAPARALLGKRFWELEGLVRESFDLDAHRARLERHESFRDVEYTYVDRSGKRFYVRVDGEPVFDAQGAFAGYRGTSRDITQQRRDEEELRRFRAAMDMSLDSICLIDRATLRFLDVNEAACRGAGLTREQFLAKGPHEVLRVPKDELERVYDALIAEGGTGKASENRYTFRDGRSGWTELHRRALRIGQSWIIVSISRDITSRKREEEKLRRFRAALDAAADPVLLVDARSGAYIDFNEAACRVLGYTRDELLGMRADQIRVDRAPQLLLEDYKRLTAEPGKALTDVGSCRRKDGSTFPVEFTRRVLETSDGPIVVANARDLTAQVRAEQRQAAHLRYQERIARFGQAALVTSEPNELVDQAVQAVLETLAADAVAYFESEPGVGGAVPRAVVGVADADPAPIACAPGDPILQVMQSGGRLLTDGAKLPLAWARELRSVVLIPVLGEGEVHSVLCACYKQPDAFGAEELNFAEAAASVLSTALRRIDSERRVAYLAQFDPLTGLPNRTLLADRFSQMIVQAKRRNSLLGVLFIDLDDFKLVNDTLGHAAGDALLKEVAVRLQSSVRSGDTVARISGDEFAIVLGDLARQEDAAIVAQKVIARLAAAVEIHGKEVFVTASVGIALYPADGADAETLIGAADAAMYRAKQSGRNAFQFFTAEINQRSRARAQLGSELRRALEREEFALVYQPKVHLADRRPSGAEALLRWKHPERGVVSPAEFIPVLEETGLIVPVGDWVLRRACEDLKAWRAAGLELGRVSVNLSARQFRLQDLDTRIKAVVASVGVDPSLIELEITESQLMQDPQHAIRVMRALCEAGMRIAIDDFGTGYSSLAYLTRFPVGSLKIDRSFVKDMGNDKSDATIVRTIIEMAHTLGFTVVAEGVETEEQATFLRLLRCEQAQGYLFAKPMPAADLVRLFAA